MRIGTGGRVGGVGRVGTRTGPQHIIRMTCCGPAQVAALGPAKIVSLPNTQVNPRISLQTPKL